MTSGEPVRPPHKLRPGPTCVCGHPPVDHGCPGFFGANTICLVLGCACTGYQDTYDVREEPDGR